MNESYTIFNQNSTYDYTSLDDIDDAIDYLKNPSSFRSFNIGLTELLVKKGYSGKTNDINALSEFLISRLKKINSDISKGTVTSWFSGERRPKVEHDSRSTIYEICFALELSYEETLWFFHHVYYDRAFNCHIIGEAVYYFAFKNKLTYTEAQAIIKEVTQASTLCTASDTSEIYTQLIKNRIDNLESVAELKAFLIQNKNDFNTWNKSALDLLNNLKYIFIGSPESKAVIDKLKRRISPKRGSNKKYDLNNYQSCGLLMKEILFDAQSPDNYDSSEEYILEAIHNKNIFSNDFILDRLLTTSAGMQKNKEIPYVLRSNFPSKKIMSDILSEKKSQISVSTSYDAIRKMIVLFSFYCFWAEVKLGITDLERYSSNELPEIYIEQTNDYLQECGYENLYAGNPYDWIFLCSAQSEDPLAYFRSCIADMLPDNF